MVAGMFAFIPVEQASTVHTTVQGSQEGVIIRSDNGVNISDNDTVVIDCDNDFILQDTLWSLTDHDSATGTEAIDIGTTTTAGITIDDLDTMERDGDFALINLFTAGGADDNDTSVISWSGLANELQLIQMPVTISAVGAGNNDIVFTLQDLNESIDATDRLTVTATILSQSDSTCSVTINS